MGGAIGGTTSGLVGLNKRRSTGGAKAFLNSLAFQNQARANEFEQLQQFGESTQSIFRGIAGRDAFAAGQSARQTARLSPVFNQLEQRALGDLNDPARTQRLTEAFNSNLRSAQAARGVTTSGSSAFQEGLQGLQFQEQLRQQSFQNALQFSGSQGQFQQGFSIPQAGFGFSGQNIPGFNLGLDLFAFKQAQRERDINSSGQAAAGIGSLVLGGGVV